MVALAALAAALAALLLLDRLIVAKVDSARAEVDLDVAPVDLVSNVAVSRAPLAAEASVALAVLAQDLARVDGEHKVVDSIKDAR